MEKFLLFRLYGPMASWGEIAVGEVRRTASHPTRSAILGLVSAALGIRREETEKLAALFAGYEVAAKVLSSGSLLRDYHTIQVPDNVGKTDYLTRRDEVVMGKPRLSTILSSREYRCDSLCFVALKAKEGAPYSFNVLMEKLLRPEFVLYLGRKSCPLAAPLAPMIVVAEGFRTALDKATFPALLLSKSGNDITDKYIEKVNLQYYWEGDAGDMQPQQSTERYDEPLNRLRWQFAPRIEHSFISKGDE